MGSSLSSIGLKVCVEFGSSDLGLGGKDDELRLFPYPLDFHVGCFFDIEQINTLYEGPVIGNAVRMFYFQPVFLAISDKFNEVFIRICW